MRHGRSKQARKTLQFFERSITAACRSSKNHTNSSSHPAAAAVGGKQKVYHVVVDGTFVVAILQYKIPLLDRLDSLLQHTHVRLYVCASTVTELELLQEQQQQPSKRARNSSTAQCDENQVDGDKTMNSPNLFGQAIQWCQENCQVLSQPPPVLAANTDADDLNNSSATNKNTKSSKKHRSTMVPTLSPAANDILALVSHDDAAGAFKRTGDNTAAAVGQDSSLLPSFYFCASQDEDLLHRLRSLSSSTQPTTTPSKATQALFVPLIRLARGSVLLLEQPSKTVTRISDHFERKKFGAKTTTTKMAVHEQELVQLVYDEQKKQKRQQQHSSVAASDSISTANPLFAHSGGRPALKPKGPNPLSCKKKRPPATSTIPAMGKSDSVPVVPTTTATDKGNQDSTAPSRSRKRRRKTTSDSGAVVDVAEDERNHD